MSRPNVLLVGESLNQHSLLAQRLASWGDECQFAISHKDVCALIGQQTFELVISEMNLVDGSALRMSPLFEGTTTSLFCSYPI
jgi:DNA-binding NtrC family response regulator